ncbi:Crp/Fnr family transcriptional regulator [Desulfovibrio sp. OttesenSCG-928-C06]|nr:Crp/Fnr family transcriptional regulator [Desulfovibrio sp. OttesenSCG-928-C06]
MDNTQKIHQKMHWHLIGHDFFADLTPDEREKFYALSKRHVLKRNQVIFNEGEMAHSCFYIEQGVLQSYRVTPQGKSTILFIRGQGDIFGLAELVNRGVRKHFTSAMTSAVVHELSEEGFEQLLMSSPVLTRRMMEVMGRRVRFLNEQMQDLMSKGVAERLLKLFVCLSYEQLLQNLPENKPVPLGLRLTQEEMGAMIGSCQQTISQTLHALQKKGFISLKGRSIAMENPRALLEALGLSW